jgi:hypothetical protein
MIWPEVKTKDTKEEHEGHKVLRALRASFVIFVFKQVGSAGFGTFNPARRFPFSIQAAITRP